MPEPTESAGREPARLPAGACVAACVAATALGLVLLGAFGHPCPVPGGENDRYVEAAELLLAGRPAHDRFHPFLYPLLVAAATPLAGDAFAAGRLVSALAGAGLVLAVWLLARELLPARRALPAVLATAVSPHLLVTSVQATTETTATLFLLLCLWAAVRHRRTGGAAAVFAAGLAAGLAIATRFSSYVALPLVAWTVLAAPRRWRAAGCALGGLLLGYLPHALVALLHGFRAFGSDNWQNLVLKVECDMHYGRFYELHLGGLPGPWAWLAEWWDETLGLLVADLGHWLQHGALPLWLGFAAPPLWGLLFAAALAAAFVGLGFHSARGRMACLLALLQLLLVCTVLVPEPRLLLPLVPLGIVAAAAAGHGLRGRARRVCDGAALLLLLLSAAGAVATARAFVAAHPLAEIALARGLPARLQRAPVLISTYNLMGSAVDYPVLTIAFRGRSDAPSPAELFSVIERSVDKHGADAAMVGRITRPSVFAVLRGTEPPAGLSVLHADDDVLLFGAAPAPSGWIEVREVALRDGRIRCRVALSPEADRSRVVGAGVSVLDPAHRAHTVAMAPEPDGGWVLEIMAAPGVWHLTPGLLLTDHGILRGGTHTVRVP